MMRDLSWSFATIPAARTLGLAGLALLLAAGCATTGPRAELPFGEWLGEGTFVYQEWEDAGEAPEAAMAAPVTRTYTTNQAIGPARIDDTDVIKVEIISERGRLGQHDDSTRTHLRLALVETESGSDATTLYRVVGFQYNPHSWDELELASDSPPVGAACTAVDGQVVLQIPYTEHFFDILRFDGRTVEKWGVFSDPDSGFVHWHEQLRRIRSGGD